MKAVLNFITLPLSLPISPIWDYLICILLGEIAFRIAYSLAGQYGSTSGERTLLHWIIRILCYLLLWLVACFIILVVNFIKVHWMWVLIGFGVLALAGIVVLILCRLKKKSAGSN